MARCCARRLAARVPLVLALTGILLGLLTVAAAAQEPDGPVPPPPPEAPADPVPPEQPEGGDADGLEVTLDDDEGLSQTVTTLLLLTIAAVAPALLMLMTTFTRFVVVLGLARQGLGLQAVPPAQVLVGLAVFLSLFSMSSTLGEVNEVAVQPLLAGEMDALEAAEAGYEPLRGFMLAQTDEDDLRMFLELQDAEDPSTPEEIGATTLVPAFVISELRTAFTIGFVVFVPFLIIDLVTAAVLMSLGMVMLPPIFVSLPLKLLLFVLIDGWTLLGRSLVQSVG
ncbi:MAG: flagellar type III secretion system pore protein FliP, partial [Nitriliruptoraceae bacterium]